MLSAATANNSRIAVVGAGLMGRLLAWQLLKQGHKVTLFEKTRFEHSRSAAYTAAAMISPMSEVVVSERLIYDLGIESLTIWPGWIEDLNTSTQECVHYSQEGSIVLAHSADTSELDQFYSDLSFHLGVDNTARWLSASELSALEPDIANHFGRALLLPGEAYLDNRKLLSVLLDVIRDLGGDCRDQSSISFDPQPKLNGDELCDFDTIIDSRGVGARQSNEFSRGSLRGVRGEVLWVQTPEVKLKRPIRLMHPRYKLYIVPKPDDCYIIGATEIESQDLSPISVQSTLELCSALYTLNPAFAEARIIEMDANLRPSYLDNLPLIEDEQVVNSSHDKQRLIRVNGLYRHGYLLAPALVNKLVALLS